MTIHKGTENDFADLNSLSKHLKKNAALFRKERLYVIVDSTTQPEKTAVILELLNDQKIDNYKVLNLIEYLTPPKPEPTDVAVNDSSYLSIRVIDSGFVITLLDKKQVVKNLREIDNFITANKPLINPRKIKIIAPGNTPYEKWGPALEALAKHEYYGYKLVSE